MFPAPVILIAFNRPEPFRRVLVNLAAAHGIQDREIRVFVDGPRNESDRILGDQVASVAESFRATLPKMTLVRRERNLGCRENVVRSVSEVMDSCGRAIIVEDDVLVSHTFLDYMDAALDLYADNPRVWGINAWRNRFVHVPASYPNDVYLTPRMLCWGWGSWKNRWNQVDFDLSDWPVQGKLEAMHAMLDAAGVDLHRMLQLQYEGVLKTWDVQCCYHVVKNGLFCVEPRYALTKNIGSGVNPTHCDDEDPLVSHAAYYDFTPRLIADLQPDAELLRQFPHALFNPSLSVRVWRRLLRVLFRYLPQQNQPHCIPPAHAEMV